MEVVRNVYDVSVDVTFTGADLALLWESSRNHYDWKCWSLSNRGWLSQLLPVFHYTHGGKDASSLAEKDQIKFCGANPTLTIEEHLSFSELDLLGKTLEVSLFKADRRDSALALQFALKRLLQDLNSEYRRLNPRRELDE